MARRSAACLRLFAVLASLFLLGGAATLANAQQQPIDVSGDIRQAIETSGIPGQGAAAVFLRIDRQGQVTTLAQGAAGKRRYDQDTAVNVDDTFAVASCSKSFTAYLLGFYVTQHRLSWDDTVPTILARNGVVLPSLHPDWTSVTVRHILHHRAGFVRDTDFNELWTANRALYQTLSAPTGDAAQRANARQAFAAYHLSRKAAFPLGTFSYSNVGYDVASWIVELVGRQDYESIANVFVFQRFGFTGGYQLPYPVPVPSNTNTVVAHDCRDATGLSLIQPDWWWQAPFRVGSGGLYMRVRDLAAWTAHHVRGIMGMLPDCDYSLVSREAFQELHRPWTAPDGPDGGAYAMGWNNFTNLDRMLHDGSLVGARTLMMGFTQADAQGNLMAVAVSTNVREDLTPQGNSASGRCAKAVQAIFPGVVDKLVWRFRAAAEAGNLGGRRAMIQPAAGAQAADPANRPPQAVSTEPQ